MGDDGAARAAFRVAAGIDGPGDLETAISGSDADIEAGHAGAVFLVDALDEIRASLEYLAAAGVPKVLIAQRLGFDLPVLDWDARRIEAVAAMYDASRSWHRDGAPGGERPLRDRLKVAPAEVVSTIRARLRWGGHLVD